MPHGLTSTMASRQDLAARLKWLLLAAERRPGGRGRLKRSALARTIGVSPSSLYAYLDGTTLPPADVLDRLLDALDVVDAERRRLATARDVLETRRQVRNLPPAGEPPLLTVPRQLPADVPAFTGRAAHLDQLDALLTSRDNGATTVVISAIGGAAGVGKTALAVHWAHRVADRFPDAQLYVNLRGFDPGGVPVDPAVAVRGFLDALAVAPQRIPATLEAQSALYRSLLAGRRVLVLLDNARDVEQVRPLLPGTSGCCVVVTSRNQLSGLVAAEGARPLTLDLLTRAEARQLLRQRLGPERVSAEREATDEIITRCVRLPLALAVVAARAVTHPEFPLAALAAELCGAPALDAFTGQDTGADLRAVLSWSYRVLTPDAARLFRLLGLHPGPDIGVPAAASLAALPAAQVRPLLAHLAGAHLLTEHRPGRYTCHDLLRAFATELGDTVDTEPDRRTAVHRILGHYLHTAYTAAVHLHPHRDPITLAPSPPGVTAEQLADHEQAQAWFSTEYSVLLALIAQAADGGFPTHSWQLAWTLRTFFERRGHWHDMAATHRTALDAARQSADLVGQAQSYRGLAGAHLMSGRVDDAHIYLHRALDLFRELGDHTAQARIHLSLGYVIGRQDNHSEALHHAEQALELFRAAAYRPGQASALNDIGWYHSQLKHHQDALTYCQLALTLHQEEAGDRPGEAHTWDSLGYVHHQLGRHQEATDCYLQALTLFRDLGDRYYQANTLAHLGATHDAAGEPDTAREMWRQALVILDELDHPDADQIRTKLGQVASTRTQRCVRDGVAP